MELNGPMFNGVAERAAADLAREIEETVSDKGFDLVQGRLIQVIRKPTPYYWTQLEKIKRRGGTEITGESVIYHWWLEGKGSRNYPVTRFKGYATFEITTGVLDARAEALAQEVCPRFVRRMGGGS